MEGAGADVVEPLGYRPPLDGLRGIAIAAVVAFHVDRGGRAALWPAGFLGVDIFFVLSGFLITSLLIDESNGAGRIRLGAFWGRRAARLFPLLWGLLAFLALVRWVHPVAGIAPPSPHGFAALVGYVGNWLPALGHNGLFEMQYLWSLSVEEQFYVVWPLLVILALRIDRQWAITAGATFLAVAVGFGRWQVFTDTNYFFNTFLRSDGLLLGAALAGCRAWWQPRLGSRRADVATVVGLVLLAVAIVGAHVGDPTVRSWRLPVLAIGVCAVAAGLVARPTTPLARALSTPPLVWLGRISYALYLVHLVVFDVFQAHLGLDRPRLRAVVEIPVAVAIAAVLHRWYELPAQRWLRHALHAEHRVAEHAPAKPSIGIGDPAAN